MEARQLYQVPQTPEVLRVLDCWGRQQLAVSSVAPSRDDLRDLCALRCCHQELVEAAAERLLELQLGVFEKSGTKPAQDRR
eukprot:s3865_g2.t1